MSELSVLSSSERQDLIVKHIQKEKRLTIDQICQKFQVSTATARRDLETLVAKGLIQRFHGGAKSLSVAPPELPALQREHEHQSDKRSIGQLAASLIEDGDTVFLGTGTTVLEVARQLHDRQRLTVISNSLLVLNELAKNSDITLIILGGLFRPTELSLVGHITEQALREVRASKAVLGVRGIDIDHGLSNEDLAETMTDRAVLNNSETVILVADSSKCERVATAFLAPVTTIHTFVTDSKTPESFTNALVALGIDVLRTPDTSSN